MKDKFDILTYTAAVGLSILSFVLGVGVLTYGCVLIAKELSEWLAGR